MASMLDEIAIKLEDGQLGHMLSVQMCRTKEQGLELLAEIAEQHTARANAYAKRRAQK